MVSRMKRIALGTLAVCIGLLAVMQFIHFQQGYSPLRMLYSSQSEAQRLLRFLTSYHYQCKEVLNSSEVLEWPVCLDPGVGVHSASAENKGPPALAYCIGPVSDFRFETMLSQNLSLAHQLIFVPASTQPLTIPLKLAQHNGTILYHATVVANDPADFSRNSYDMTTVNSIMRRLGHSNVDILKLVHMQDPLQSYEILYFMARDGVLQKFRQLHTRIDIEKADDDYLYSWYKTLFTIFHTAGFRLYHTSASSPLCLQVTTMESCQYFVSWVRDPGPLTHILYPPASDGSEHSELQRLKDFVEGPENQQDGDMVSVVLSSTIILSLSRTALLASGTTSKCSILVFIPKNSPAVQSEVSALGRKCSVLTLSPVNGGRSVYSHTPFSVRGTQSERSTVTLTKGLGGVLPAGSLTTVLYVDLGQSSWPVLTALMDSGALQTVNQLLLVAPVYPGPVASRKDQRGGGTLTLRQRYSELKRLTAFHLTLAAATPKHHTSEGDFWLLSFVKS